MSFAENFNEIYYERIILTFSDNTEIDITVDRPTAQAIKAGDQHVLESIRKNYQSQICHTDESELKKKGCDEHIVKEHEAETTQKLQSVGNVEEKNDLIKKAKEIKDKIMTFLATHKVTSPLPRANDTFIIPFLTPTEDDSITENSKFELATYLALNYPRLCDVSQDASSLLHDTVEFVSNYRHDFKEKEEDHQQEKELPSLVSPKEKSTTWFHSDVLNLMNCYKERRGEMGNPTMKKVEVWARISQDLLALGTKKEANACEKKWNNLKIRYRSIKDSNTKTGGECSTWLYYEEINNILCKDPSIKPPKIISSTKPSTAPAEMPEDKDKLPKAADKPEEPKKKKKKLAPTWMEEFIQENHKENERRREEFKEFRKEFLDLQREKNDILKTLVSNMQK